MSNILLHLCSAMPAVFCVNGEQVGCCDNPTQYVSICISQEKFVLYVYPLKQIHRHFCSLSYSVQINCKANKPLCNSDLITITDYGHNHFVIFADSLMVPRLPNCPPCSSAIDDCTATAINNNLYITNENHNFSYALTEPLSEIKLTKLGELYSLNAKTQNNQDFIMVLNKKLQLIFDCLTDKIEVDGNHIVTLQYVHDIARHGIVNDYEVKNASVTKMQKYTVYTQNTPTVPANIYAVPYAFLEAIMIKNYNLAHTYLHPSLSQTLQNEHLSKYFGNFIDMSATFDYPQNVLALIYDGTPRFVKYYSFDLQDNRIINIDTQE